jgi:hypothetical protein
MLASLYGALLEPVRCEECHSETGKGWDESAVGVCRRLLSQAAQNFVPVAITAGDKIKARRHWASDQCVSAGRSGAGSTDGLLPHKPSLTL